MLDTDAIWNDLIANLSARWPFVGAILAAIGFMFRKEAVNGFNRIRGMLPVQKGGDPVLDGIAEKFSQCRVTDDKKIKLLQATRETYVSGLKAIEGTDES